MDAVVHVEVYTHEYSPYEPYRKIGEEEYEGTAFGVEASIFREDFRQKHPGRYFLTNFHVVDNAKNKKVRLSTPWLGKKKLLGRVVHVVPYLDVAVIAVRADDKHRVADPEAALRRIKTLPLDPRPLRSRNQACWTVGFPMGLELHKTPGTVAHRGSEDMDLIGFSLPLNAGNSGGPIIVKHKVVAVATSTLNEAESISFGIPATSILHYFQKWSDEPFGKFPRWGFKCMPLTDAYKKEHSFDGNGAVVYAVEPEIKNIKKGDIITGIEDVELDDDGLFHDPTRDEREAMVNMNNSEFIMRLPPNTHVRLWRRGFLKVKRPPVKIHYSVSESYSEWNPPKWCAFGSMVFQVVTKTLLGNEDICPTKSIPILQDLKNANFRKEIICISYIHPESYVQSLNVLEDFDVVKKVGRHHIKSFKDFQDALRDVADRWRRGEQKRVCITTDKPVHLTMDKLAEDEHVMSKEMVPGLMLCKKRSRISMENES